MRRPRRLPSISSLTAGHTSRWAAGHTEEGDCATRPREDAHGAHVLLAHCILHARDDGSGRCCLQSSLDRLREGIYGAVCLHLLLINIGFCGHGGRIGRSGRVCRRGLGLAMAVRYNEVASISDQTTLARAFCHRLCPQLLHHQHELWTFASARSVWICFRTGRCPLFRCATVYFTARKRHCRKVPFMLA
jgi:hypothetical protein